MNAQQIIESAGGWVIAKVEGTASTAEMTYHGRLVEEAPGFLHLADAVAVEFTPLECRVIGCVSRLVAVRATSVIALYVNDTLHDLVMKARVTA